MKVVLNRDGTGKVVYNSEIIRDIVDCALAEVKDVVRFAPGNKRTKNFIKVDTINDNICIDVSVKLKHNVSVSEVAGEIQSAVKRNLESMTEFKVSYINVHVIDIDFDEK